MPCESFLPREKRNEYYREIQKLTPWLLALLKNEAVTDEVLKTACWDAGLEPQKLRS